MSKRRKKRTRYCERQVALWVVRGRARMSKRVQSLIDAAAVAACENLLPHHAEALTKAMLLNCDDAETFPFPRLDVPFLSEREFYRRRAAFLDAVFERLKVGKE